MSNTELTIIDDIKNDVILKESNTVPMSSIFGRGVSVKEESFGGRSLAENAQLVDKAMDNLVELEDVWNHSHSQWIWKHITLSWVSPYSNIKQIAAEMQRKKSALNEAKWKQVRNEIKLRKLREKLENGIDDHWEEIEAKAKMCELIEAVANGTVYIEGAMKDVLILNELYEQLKAQVEGFTEEELEKHESKSHLKRSLMQSIRDVRQFGVITKGEQEYMEQVGANPTKMLHLIKGYLKREEESDRWDNAELIQFINDAVDDLIDNKKIDVTRMESFKFSHDPKLGISYHKKIAEKDGS